MSISILTTTLFFRPISGLPLPYLSPQRASTRHNNGWTLVEVIAVLTILTLLAGTGAPHLSTWLQNTAQSTVFNTLHHLTTFARAKAIKDNDYFTVCASEDQKHCNGQWNKTLIVFNDTNQNETVDSDETLFRTLSFPKSTPCLQWNAGARKTYLQFKPSGATNGTAGHFRFCDTSANSSQQSLVVSFSGRTSIRKLSAR